MWGVVWIVVWAGFRDSGDDRGGDFDFDSSVESDSVGGERRGGAAA